MWKSRPVGPASVGAAAVGVALLFGTGAFGFYVLGSIAGAGRSPSHAPKWSPDEFEDAGGHHTSPAQPPVEPNAAPEAEAPDVFAPPTAIMGVMPGN